MLDASASFDPGPEAEPTQRKDKAGQPRIGKPRSLRRGACGQAAHERTRASGAHRGLNTDTHQGQNTSTADTKQSIGAKEVVQCCTSQGRHAGATHRQRALRRDMGDCGWLANTRAAHGQHALLRGRGAQSEFNSFGTHVMQAPGYVAPWLE